MFTFAYPAKLTTGRDGRVLVEFVDLPRVATDGKDDARLLKRRWTLSDPIYPSACHAARKSRRTRQQSASIV